MAGTHYDTLGVPRDATSAAVRKAYLSRARHAHPDHGGTNEAFDRLTRAYEVLRVPASRMEYDAELETAEDATAPIPPVPPTDAPRRSPPTPDAWLPQAPDVNGLVRVRLADAPHPSRLEPGGWVIAGMDQARSMAYVVGNNNVLAILALPGNSFPLSTWLTDAPVTGPARVPLVRGRTWWTNDGQHALKRAVVEHAVLPDMSTGARVVVELADTWIPGSLGEILIRIQDNVPMWEIVLGSWDPNTGRWT